jgi:hypothetical protein
VNKVSGIALGVLSRWLVLAAPASAADKTVTTRLHLEAIAARLSRGQAMKRRRARSVALICGVVLVAACASSHKSSTPPTTATSPAGSAPTSGSPTSMPAAPTTSPRISPPATFRRVVPSIREISLELNRTVEIADKTTHFSANDQPGTVSDGAGGWLTALIGVRFPTADGKGELVFFWHNTTFVGLDTHTESERIISVSASASGAFAVRYVHYALTDPLCCPSLAPVTIEYRWSGHAMAPSGLPPGHRAGETATITTLP